jgi:hypothetical protein
LRIIEANVVAIPQQKLADALDTLRTLQDRNLVAIRSDDLSRRQRELLMKQSSGPCHEGSAITAAAKRSVERHAIL